MLIAPAGLATKEDLPIPLLTSARRGFGAMAHLISAPSPTNSGTRSELSMPTYGRSRTGMQLVRPESRVLVATTMTLWVGPPRCRTRAQISTRGSRSRCSGCRIHRCRRSRKVESIACIGSTTLWHKGSLDLKFRRTPQPTIGFRSAAASQITFPCKMVLTSFGDTTPTPTPPVRYWIAQHLEQVSRTRLCKPARR